MRQAVPSRARAEGEPGRTGPITLAPVAGTAAAFTGRAHGNVSFLVGGGDPAAARRALGPSAGTDPGDAVFMEQVHGSGVAVVTRAQAGSGLAAHADAVPSVDALVTAEPGVALVVLTADCVPVLLASRGVVGAVHAGRAGLPAGVIEAALGEMERLGAPAGSVTAVIGPAIGGCCYEVPDALARQAGERIGELTARTTWATPSLDLPAGAAAVLRRAGVARIGVVGGCTRCDPERWFSHRAVTDGREPAGQEGRQASVVALTPTGGNGAAPARLPREFAWLS